MPSAPLQVTPLFACPLVEFQHPDPAPLNAELIALFTARHDPASRFPCSANSATVHSAAVSELPGLEAIRAEDEQAAKHAVVIETETREPGGPESFEALRCGIGSRLGKCEDGVQRTLSREDDQQHES